MLFDGAGRGILGVSPLESVSREYIIPEFCSGVPLTLTVAFSSGMAPLAVDTLTMR